MLLLASSYAAVAQASLALGVFSERNQAYVAVKAILPGIINKEGLLVYRKTDDGAWQQVSSEPIQYQKSQPSASAASNYKEYVALADALAEKPADESGLLTLAIGTEAVTNNEFAKYLGLWYSDYAVEAGRTYTYQLRSVNGEIVSGEKTISVDPDIKLAPAAEVQVSQKRKTVQIGYKPEPYRYFSTNIYRKNGDLPYAKINTSPVVFVQQQNENGEYSFPEVFFEDDAVTPGNTYTYQVVAVDYFGREGSGSAPEQITVVDPTKPAAPEEVSVVAESRQEVVVSWKHSGENIKNYLVEKARNPNGPWQETIVAKENSTHKSILDSYEVWYFRVAAVSLLNILSYSDIVLFNIADKSPPAKVEGVVVEPLPGQINLRWQPNTETDLLGYNVYFSINKGANWEKMNSEPLPANQYSYTFSGKTANELMFKVLAQDESGNLSPDAEIVSTKLPDSTPPVAPTIAEVKQEEENVIVRWNSANEPDLAGFFLFRSEEGKPAEQLNINRIPGTAQRYTDRRAKPATRYTYSLVAVDEGGNASDTSAIYPFFTKQGQAASLTFKELKVEANRRKSQAALQWSLAAENLRGVIVYRQAKDGKMLPISDLLTTQEFIDKSVEAGSEYTYQVRAYPKKGRPVYSEKKNLKIPEKN